MDVELLRKAKSRLLEMISETKERIRHMWEKTGACVVFDEEERLLTRANERAQPTDGTCLDSHQQTALGEAHQIYWKHTSHLQ